jgi:hypothetical protein
VIGSGLKISIDRIDWKIFKEDYKQIIIIIIIKRLLLSPFACLDDTGYIRSYLENPWIGPNKLNETKSFQLIVESFRNPE